MVDVVQIKNVLGSYSPIDREYLKDGDYFRLPDGRVFQLVKYSPKTEIEPVEEKDIPNGVEIVEMVDHAKDSRFRHS